MNLPTFLSGFFERHLKLKRGHVLYIKLDFQMKINTKFSNSWHVPLAMCRGIQCSAGRCWRALLCHTQYLQTLSLRPTAPMTGQHGRVHPLTGRIWSHNHNNTHTPTVTQTSTVCSSWTLQTLLYPWWNLRFGLYIYNYIYNIQLQCSTDYLYYSVRREISIEAEKEVLFNVVMRNRKLLSNRVNCTWIQHVLYERQIMAWQWNDGLTY